MSSVLSNLPSSAKSAVTLLSNFRSVDSVEGVVMIIAAANNLASSSVLPKILRSSKEWLTLPKLKAFINSCSAAAFAAETFLYCPLFVNKFITRL